MARYSQANGKKPFRESEGDNEQKGLFSYSPAKSISEDRTVGGAYGLKFSYCIKKKTEWWCAPRRYYNRS